MALQEASTALVTNFLQRLMLASLSAHIWSNETSAILMEIINYRA